MSETDTTNDEAEPPQEYYEAMKEAEKERRERNEFPQERGDGMPVGSPPPSEI